ncbi:hypothetical protein [Occultella kanbiaonis]|uniref:hypothetical protein n=1 Tax=Occultella kanbiaonis TaxID=2675754 RepID=UPI0013D4F4A3|nr:hypothetical protein [Occultella kanbiaonis]
MRYLIESTRRGADEPELYQVELDLCWMPWLASAGIGDIAAASHGWGGDGEQVVEPRLVEHPGLLEALIAASWDRNTVDGTEPEQVLAERFRLHRRVDDLEAALLKQGKHVPRPRRDHGVTMAMMQAQSEFADRVSTRREVAFDEEDVSFVLNEWNEASFQGTEWTITEHRVQHHRNLLGDYYEDSTEILELLAEWVRFLGERTDADPALVERTEAVARGAQRSATACPDIDDLD